MRSIYTLLFIGLAMLLPHQKTTAQSGIGTNTPDPNAVLDITSASKGLLLPSLTATQRSTLAASLNAGETGMLVRDATTGTTIYWTGAAWQDISDYPITATTPLSVSTTNNIALNPGTAAGQLITWDGTNWVSMAPATQHFTITVDNRQPWQALNYCIGLTGIFPSRNTLDPFVGEIDLFSFNFPPKGYAQCNGQLLAINSNTALFSLLGITYGGNGITNFELPNLQSRVPVNYGQGTSLSNYTIGQMGGSESSTITQ